MEMLARSAKDLGQIVRRHRRRLHLSQQQLGEKIHLRQATISKLEAGEPATQLRTLLDALSALNLEIVVRPRTTASPNDIEAVF